MRLTVPMFLGISSMILASMIDTIYIGWIGTQQLAAVSFSFPVVMALSSVTHTVIGAYLPLSMQVLHGASDEAAGYAVTALALSWTIASMTTSHIHGQAAMRSIVIGQGMCLIGLSGMALAITDLPFSMLVTRTRVLSGPGEPTSSSRLTARPTRRPTRSTTTSVLASSACGEKRTREPPPSAPKPRTASGWTRTRANDEPEPSRYAALLSSA